MFHLGESQELYVVKEVGFGIYLGEEENATEKVLLPKKEVPEGIKAGDILEVFLYKDSQDRLIATTRTPKVRLGETAVLRVADTGKIGAFLDWGLEKDLFLPYKEQILANCEQLIAGRAREEALRTMELWMKILPDDEDIRAGLYLVKVACADRKSVV